jgi:hypothetical protein
MNPVLIVPITKERFQEAIQTPDNSLKPNDWSFYELCSLLTIDKAMDYGDSDGATKKAETALSELIAIKDEESEHQLKIELIRNINLPSLSRFNSLTEESIIRFMDIETIKKNRFLNDDGGWKWNQPPLVADTANLINLPNNKDIHLTREQFVALQEVNSNIGDHMHIQGFAGSGKTKILTQIAGHLAGKIVDPRKIKIVARNQVQRDAIEARLPSELSHHQVVGIRELIFNDCDWGLKRFNRTYTKSSHGYADIAETLSFPHIKEAYPGYVVRLCMAAIERFCLSLDLNITFNHFDQLDRRLKSANSLDREVITKCAKILWNEIFEEKLVHIWKRDFHIVKKAHIDGLMINDNLEAVLFDEAQDISSPLMEILDRSRISVITLGDQYQALGRRAIRRPDLIRCRELSHSIRLGKGTESIINPMLKVHPDKPGQELKENKNIDYKISFYNKSPDLSNKDTVLVVGGFWGLFEWSQRLTHAKTPFNYATQYKMKNLESFVVDLIGLYRRNEYPSHPALRDLRSQIMIGEAATKNRSIKNVSEMMDKGYKQSDWHTTSSSILERATKKQPKLLLATVDDLKNREFGTVVLSPEIVDECWDYDRDEARFSIDRLNTLYTSITRASNRLVLPIELQSWLEEVSSHSC